MKKKVLGLIVLYRKLQMWGVKGVIDFLLRQGKERKERSYFCNNAKKYPIQTPQPGITIVGDLSSFGSLSKVLRDFAFSLKDAGIPFQTFDTGVKDIPKADIDGILTKASDFRIRKYSHVVEMITSHLPNGIIDNRARIVFWEFNEGVGEGYPYLMERNDGIIAMSDFNYEYFAKEFSPRCKVFKIPYPLRIDVADIASKDDCRKKFGLKREDYIVFYNFAYSSGWKRKNSIGVVRAFARAFKNIPDAILVLKTSSIDKRFDREKELLAIAEAEGVFDRVVIFNNRMTQKQVYELTNTCDVYLSLHRAEGFGLGIAEAMCMGKAVIATDYSATTEFCKPENSMLIPFNLIKVDDDEKKELPATRWTHFWADPDVDAAAEALRQLYTNKTLRLELGCRARDFILRNYSIDNFREAILKFLG